MDLPAHTPERGATPEGAAEALGAPVVATWRWGANTMLVVDDEATVAAFSGDPAVTGAWSTHLAIVTAPTDDLHRREAGGGTGGVDGGASGGVAADGGVDFVSRVFAPGAGVPEDPVTGSAHSMLVPYWCARLNRHEVRARQISRRGGDLWCELHDDRVHLEGHAVLYSAGLFNLPD